MAISVETDEQWSALCAVIGAETLGADPALATVDGRRERHDEIDAAIEAWTRTRPAADVAAALTAAGVPAAVFAEAHHIDRLPEV